MARAWSGFLPQNESIKRQWGLLESPPSEIADSLQAILREMDREGAELGADEENFEFFRMNKTREASGT
jgi:hypothetical protein